MYYLRPGGRGGRQILKIENVFKNVIGNHLTTMYGPDNACVICRKRRTFATLEGTLKITFLFFFLSLVQYKNSLSITALLY